MANYVLLERIELNADAASVTFSNIPQTGYTDLKVVMSTRNNASSGGRDYASIRFNGDSGNNYSRKWLYGLDNSTGSGSGTSEAGLNVIVQNDSLSTANTFSNTEVYIPNFTGSQVKSVSIDSVAENNSSITWVVEMSASLWNSTAAINSMTICAQISGGTSANFVQYSTFSLYGLAAVGTTPAIAPKASGGNITTDGTYWIHTFLTSDTFTPAVALTCDYLVVAGGGGSGGDYGGGGGGGGYRTSVGTQGGGGSAGSALSLSATSYTITVGAGGAGGSAGNVGANGSNSILSTITSLGGGGGGCGYAVNTTPSAGGSGGGGGSSPDAAGGAASSPTQGYAGGAGQFVSGNKRANGGGGGAGAVGQNGVSSGGIASGSNGGAGITSSISGSSIGRAGGGGGANETTQGAGTDGGGTNSAGTTNTGGGGSMNYAGGAGKAGGSGIVIIRYTIA